VVATVSGTVCDATQVRVVADGEDAVGGQPEVDLHAVGAAGEAALIAGMVFSVVPDVGEPRWAKILTRRRCRAG
jgi:hypothetical protein